MCKKIIFIFFCYLSISQISLAETFTVQQTPGDNDTITVDSADTFYFNNNQTFEIEGHSNVTLINNGNIITHQTSATPTELVSGQKNFTVDASGSSNFTLTNNGTIWAGESVAVDLKNATGTITVTNNSGATLASGERMGSPHDADVLDLTGAGSSGDTITVTNHGTIQNTAKNFAIIGLDGMTSGAIVNFTNTGSINQGSSTQDANMCIDAQSSTDEINVTNSESGTIQSNRRVFILGGSTNFTLNNSGTIQQNRNKSRSTAQAPGAHDYSVIELGPSGSGATIINSGTITAIGNNNHGITIGNDVADGAHSNATIENSGTIESTVGDYGRAIIIIPASSGTGTSGTTITVKGAAVFTGGIDLGKTTSTIVLDSSISTSMTINIYNYIDDGEEGDELTVTNNLSENYTFSLSTENLDSAVDSDEDDGVLKINRGPTLSSSSPADGASNVGVNDNIVLTFSEAVDAESGNIVIKKSSDDSIVETIDVTGSKVSGSGSITITIDPSTTLDQATGYYITIDATAFDDADSASYAGISDAATLNFNTGASNPLEDKDVVGSIEAQVDVAKEIIHHSTIPVLHRMEWIRRNKEEDNLSHQGIKVSFANPMFSSIADALPVTTSFNPTEDVLPHNWAMWTKGSVTIGKTSGTDTASLKDIESTGITIGIDRKADQGLVHGFALRFGRDDVDVGSSGTSLDTDSYSLSIYRTHSYSEKTFLDSLLGISTLKTDLIRKSGANTLTGRRYGRQIFGSLSYIGVLEKDRLNLSPSMRLDVGYTNLSSYSETGKDALAYDAHNIKTGKISTGVLLDDTIQLNSITFKPNGRLEYGADFSPSSNATLSYVSDPNTDYTLSVSKRALHNFRAGLGLDIETVGGLSVITSYEKNRALDSSYSDTVRLGISYHHNANTQYALSFGGPDSSSAILDIQTTSSGFSVNFKLEHSATNNMPHQAASLSLVRPF